MHRRELLRRKQHTVLTVLRVQVQSVLYAVPAKRKPALRRSDADNALFATDLPLIAESAAVECFITNMADMGWHTELRNGWLVMDAPVPVPEYILPKELAGECGCCISLLVRHAQSAPAERIIRAVVKAADAGKQPFEKLCSQLHGEFAVRLRNHEALPGALLPYLCCAYRKYY